MSATRPDLSGKRRWENEPLLLFVEGYSDLTFYAEVMEHIGLLPHCFIQDLGGKGRGKLRQEAALLLKPTNLAKMQSVAVILDADDDAEGAFRLARNAVQDVVAVEIHRPGEWFASSQGSARFGVFIAGGEDQQVEIESLAWAAWSSRPDHAGFRGCVDEFVKCAAEHGQKIQSIDKVRIGAVLSVLHEDDPRLGPGARAEVFDFDAPAFTSLLTFLRGMAPARK